MFENRLAVVGAKTPWKLALGAVLATAAVFAVTHRPQKPHWRCRTSSVGPVTYVHVKFRSYDAAKVARAAAYEPLFTNLPVATIDDRARWARLPVQASAAEHAAEHIARDP